MEEKKRVICLTVGINESKLLRHLSKLNGYVELTEVLEAHQDNPSLKYESSFNAAIQRLSRKKLVDLEDSKIKISLKGTLLLEILFDDYKTSFFPDTWKM